MSRHPARQAFIDEDEEPAATYQTATYQSISDIPEAEDYTLPSGKTSSAVRDGFARARKAAELIVPTDDKRVRAEFRARGQPVTLFGEGNLERRARLRDLLFEESEGKGEDVEMVDESSDSGDEGDDADEEFYTEGPDALLQAKKDIAKYSLPRTAQRIAYQKEESTIGVQTHVKHRKHIKAHLTEFELAGSQVAGERPVSYVKFSPSGEILASGDWGGSIKLLDVPTLESKATLRGHTDKIGGIDWYPGATMPSSGVSPDTLNLASTGAEGSIHLWSLNKNTPIASLTGHSGRVVRTAFHPSGRYLASASYDTTWRLWDVNTSQELLLQEGHSKEVFSVAFNGDGALAASAGLDSIGRIWDLRSGRTIMLLESHVKPIYALDWGADGHRLLTGSSDGFAKCWDLRQVKETSSIGAHKGGVTDIKWFKGIDSPWSGNIKRDDQGAMQPKTSGTFFVSSGFDSRVNIFSADDWALCKSLSGHYGPVLATDVTDDAKHIASCGRDKTVKLWGRDDSKSLYE